ncbi:MAG TPA: OmpA family protein [Polyangia bacterium]|nr:OmpA family protein [Polyangia bacterium]
MRTRTVLPLSSPWLALGALASLLGVATPARAAGSRLSVQVEKSKVDLKAHRLEVKMSHPAGKVKITVVGESGATLADDTIDFAGRAAGAPLIVTWSPSSEEPVSTIDVTAYDAQGSWVGVQISPWFVSIPHEDVNFKTDRFDIEPSESPKLDAALVKINEALAKDRSHGKQHAGITLYIAGHTDTVGGSEHNRKLSDDRARSIAAWFRQHGVPTPIAFAGFGETAPAVKTADNVDEPRNRRADYVLSDGPPQYSGGLRPSWREVR